MIVYTLLRDVVMDTVSDELIVPNISAGHDFFAYMLDKKPASGGSVTFTVEGRATDTGQWATLLTYTTPNLANRSLWPQALPLLPRLRIAVIFSGSPGPCDAHIVLPSQV